MYLHEKWSSWVADKLAQSGLTVTAFARQIGMSQPIVYQWINGKQGRVILPSYPTICKLKKVFPDENWDWLLSEDEEQPSKKKICARRGQDCWCCIAAGTFDNCPYKKEE